VTTIARLTFRFWIISVNPCLVTFGDAFHEVLILFCFLKEIRGNKRTVLDCEDTRNEFRRIASHVQILRQNGLACTSICQPLQKFHVLLIAYLQVLILRTSAIESSFMLIDIRPDSGWPSTEVRLFFKLLKLTKRASTTQRSSPKAVFNISKVFAPFFLSLTQNSNKTPN
jgi:hypothetical protein